MSIKRETFEEYEMIAMLVRMVDEKDSYTSGHSERVAVYASRIGTQMGLSEEDQYILYRAGLLHDIGKIASPESILLKPDTLNEIEYQLVQEHSVLGATLIDMVSSLRHLKPIILHHHERYDGKGYPAKLIGEQTPLLARIIAVADAFDAMTTNRIYRSKKSIVETIKVLQEESGKQFDPKILEHAIEFFYKLEDSNLPQVDITSDSKMENRLAHFFKDPLTNAYNQSFLKYKITQNFKTKNLDCVYFIEILGMHRFNKTFGWEEGDKVLKHLSKKLQEIFNDSLVFRIRGDDFVILSKMHVNINRVELLDDLSKDLTNLELCIWYYDLSNIDINDENELLNLIYSKRVTQKE